MRAFSFLSLSIAATAFPSAAWRLLTFAGVYGADHPITTAMRSETTDVLLVSLGSVGGLLLLGGAMDIAQEHSRQVVRRGLALFGFAISTLLLLIELYALLNSVFHWVGNLDPQGREFPLHGSSLRVVQLCYAPLLMTGPLLLWRAAKLWSDRSTPHMGTAGRV